LGIHTGLVLGMSREQLAKSADLLQYSDLVGRLVSLVVLRPGVLAATKPPLVLVQLEYREHPQRRFLSTSQTRHSIEHPPLPLLKEPR
jgi:hypothetical protein